jgi:N-acyl-L-homoserine lactone synthetase
MSAEANPPEPPVLAIMDALVELLIARAAPVHFRVAESPAELEAVHRLRYRTVVNKGWVKPEEYPDGQERDAHDAHALQIAGWEGDVLAATVRLVLPVPGQRLPTEEAFDLAIEPRGQVVDVGRGIVERAYRDPEHRVLAALLARCWPEMRARGFLHGAAVVSKKLIIVYQQMGVQVQVLAPAHRYWGEERHPIAFDVLAGAPPLIERWFGSAGQP